MSISAEDSASVTKQLLDTEAIQSGGSCDASSCTKRLLHVLTSVDIVQLQLKE